MKSKKTRVELRPGFFTDRAWLRSANCYPGGFYGYAQWRKPYKRDCVFLNLKSVAEDFGINRDTLREWLNLLENLNLVWRHQARNEKGAHGVCLHFRKPGDYVRDAWTPVEPSHEDQYFRCRENPSTQPTQVPGIPVTSNSGAGISRHLADQVPGFPGSSLSKRAPMRRLRRLPIESSPLKHPQSAAASRTPDGARGDALTEAEREEFARDVAALPDPLRRVFSKIKDRIAPSGAPASATAGLRLEDSADEG